MARQPISAHPGWRALTRRALAWRVAHAAWSIAQLAALARIWRAVISARPDRAARGSAAFIALEGAGLVVGRGSCPAARRQAAWGDPVPFFELFLRPRPAKAAIPILAIVSGAGIAGLAARALSRPCQSRTGGRRRLRARA
jgi:hypothetical protein